jgi:hypothetical protein
MIVFDFDWAPTTFHDHDRFDIYVCGKIVGHEYVFFGPTLIVRTVKIRLFTFRWRLT